MSPADPAYRRFGLPATTSTSPAPPPSSPIYERDSSVSVSAVPDRTQTTTTSFRELSPTPTQGPSSTLPQPFTRDSLAELLDLRARWRSASALDPLGMFLLQLLADAANGVPLSDFATNLRGSAGWVAVARLIRAGLVDENGLTIYATPSGRRAADATRTLAAIPMTVQPDD